MGALDWMTIRDFLPKLAPGTNLRTGIDRILLAHAGALIVLGDGPDVLGICTGGFHFDAELTPQRLSEVAKMDGAIVLDRTSSRIAWANVHLVPDPNVSTNETGTRHRTAERVARSIGVVVIAVSEEMGTITVFAGDERRQLEPADTLANRAANLLHVLDRFKARFDQVTAELNAAEIDDVVTLREVAMVIQHAEMVIRVATVITELLSSLGERGHLIRLQRDELLVGVREDQHFSVEDYLYAPGDHLATDAALERLAALSIDELSSLEKVMAAVAPDVTDLGIAVVPRGIRLARRTRQMSAEVADQLVEHFGDMNSVVRAPIDELIDATGLDEAGARALKSAMVRSTEAASGDSAR